MKIKRPPKNKWHKPSAKAREAQATWQSSLNSNASSQRVDDETDMDAKTVDYLLNNKPRVTAPEQQDSIKIYLDDERPCPPGWTLCRTFKEFREMLRRDATFLEQVTCISLDWYLGDQERLTGFDAVAFLGQQIFNGDCEDMPYMPNLTVVSFHSSDKDQAKKMLLKFKDILGYSNREDIRLHVGSPV